MNIYPKVHTRKGLVPESIGGESKHCSVKSEHAVRMCACRRPRGVGGESGVREWTCWMEPSSCTRLRARRALSLFVLPFPFLPLYQPTMTA